METKLITQFAAGCMCASMPDSPALMMPESGVCSLHAGRRRLTVHSQRAHAACMSIVKYAILCHVVPRIKYLVTCWSFSSTTTTRLLLLVCLTGLFFLRSLQVRPGPRRAPSEEPLVIAGPRFLEARCLLVTQTTVSQHWRDVFLHLNYWQKSTLLRATLPSSLHGISVPLMSILQPVTKLITRTKQQGPINVTHVNN